MAWLSIQQLRGLKDLIQETVEAGVNAIEETHQAIARKPFAILEKIPIIALPARAVEQVQRTVTGGVYQSIRVVNRIAGAVATRILDRLEGQEETPQSPLRSLPRE